MEQTTNDNPDSNSQKYTTAKIILVGESGVGKTDLAMHLALNTTNQNLNRTELQSWVLDVNPQIENLGPCEIVLWDLPSRPDYQLIHPLLFSDTDLALIVIDPTKIQEAHSSVDFWMKQFMHQRKMQCPAILVGARVDRGSPTLSPNDIEDFCNQHNIYGGYINCSSQTGEGLTEIKERILSVINWKDVSMIVAPTFNEIRHFILSIKKQGPPESPLVTLQSLLEGINSEQKYKKIEMNDMLSAIERLEIHGHVLSLIDSTGEKWILLHPNMLINLASSFVDQARRNKKGLGTLEEDLVFKREYLFPELNALKDNDANILLNATVSLFLERNLCYRESLNNKTFLIFPTLIEEKRPRDVSIKTFDSVSYKITGAVETAYATLVVLLGYTDSFVRTNQWKDHAQYALDQGEICGFRQIAEVKGESILILNYVNETPAYAQNLFQGFFEKFLYKRDVTITRYKPVTCNVCGMHLDQTLIMNSINKGLSAIFCYECKTEQKLSPPELIKSRQVDENAPDDPSNISARRTAYETALVLVKSLLRTRDDSINPTCFISYAWGTPEHERWVIQLAKDLRNADIDVLLDRWNVVPGSNLDRYIEQIMDTNFVIIVGTPSLLQKYNSTASDPVLKAELEMVNMRLRQTTKYGHTILPVLLDGDVNTSFPPQAQKLIYVDFKQTDQYFVQLFDMIWRLFNLPFDHPMLEELRASMSS